MSISFPGTDNKALHELHDEIKDLNKILKKSNKINERFTYILIVVAILQLIVGVSQFLFSAYTFNKLVGLVSEILLFIVMALVVRAMYRKVDKKENKN